MANLLILSLMSPTDSFANSSDVWSQFTVKVSGVTVTPTSIAGSADVVTIGLAAADKIGSGDVVTIAHTKDVSVAGNRLS